MPLLRVCVQEKNLGGVCVCVCGEGGSPCAVVLGCGGEGDCPSDTCSHCTGSASGAVGESGVGSWSGAASTWGARPGVAVGDAPLAVEVRACSLEMSWLVSLACRPERVSMLNPW